MPAVLKALVDMRREELRRSLHMFGCFLLVITTFWILKPLKKSLFISYYDSAGFWLGNLHLSAARAELLAKLLNLVLASASALVFSLLARRFRRQALACLFCGVFVGSFALFGLLLDHPHAAVVWAFYLVGDLYSTLMVAALFVFLHDSTTPEAAKRSYGLVGLGAVLGGVLGSQVVSALVGALSARAWMGVCCTLTAAVAVLAWRAGNLATTSVTRSAALPQPQPERRTQLDPKPQPAALGGYLLSLAGIVGLYEIVSTILDYQFTATVSHYLDGPAIGRQLSHAFALMNVTALLLQLFVTSPLLRKQGVPVALLVLPFTALAASLGVMVLPILPIASLIPALDSGFAYSIHQSAKESLYVPLGSGAQYSAKAFVDVFVMRGAKAIGVVLSFVITTLVSDFSAVRWLSLVSLALLVPWLFFTLQAGRGFARLTQREQADSALPVRRSVVS